MVALSASESRLSKILLSPRRFSQPLGLRGIDLPPSRSQHDSVILPRPLSRHESPAHVGQHGFRLALARIAEATAAREAHADALAVGEHDLRALAEGGAVVHGDDARATAL